MMVAGLAGFLSGGRLCANGGSASSWRGRLSVLCGAFAAAITIEIHVLESQLP